MTTRRIAPYFSDVDQDEARRNFESLYVEEPCEVGRVTEDHPEQWLADLARGAAARKPQRWGEAPKLWYYALWPADPTLRPYEERGRRARSASR